MYTVFLIDFLYKPLTLRMNAVQWSMKVVKYLAYLIITIALITTAYLYSPPLDDIVVTFLPTTDQTKVQRITLNNDQPSSLLVEDSLNHTCTKKHNNFVFVKTHKTGTSTTVNILYHFGITHGLNYAVYPYSHQLYLVQPARFVQSLVFWYYLIGSTLFKDKYMFKDKTCLFSYHS